MLEYDNNYIRRLIQLDLVGGLSPEEKGKLEDWIDESEEHRLLFCKIKKQLSINEIRNYLQTDVEDAWKKVREKTFGAPAVRPRRVLKWLKYAAVVIPVSLSLSLWYAWKEKMENKQATVACLSPVLTLDNGEKYQLDPEEQTEIEEHTSELQSPYVITYAVFCLKKYTALMMKTILVLLPLQIHFLQILDNLFLCAFLHKHKTYCMHSQKS